MSLENPINDSANYNSNDTNLKRERTSPQNDSNFAKKAKKSNHIEGLDVEAEDESDEEGNTISDDEDDEEDSDDENYEADDFLVMEEENVEELDKEDDDEIQNKKVLQKLKKKKSQLRLDEEDEILIQDHLLHRVENKSSRKNHIIDTTEEEILEDNFNSPTPFATEEDEDDLNDFIAREDDEDDDDDDDDDDRNSAVKKTKYGFKRDKDGLTYDQIQEAREIFGDDFDFDEEDEDKENLNNEDDDNQGAVDGSLNVSKDKKRIQLLRSKYDRNQLVMGFCTDKDEKFRQIDLPERFFNLIVGSDEEREREVVWMVSKLSDKICMEIFCEKHRLEEMEKRLLVTQSSAIDLKNIERKKNLLPRVNPESLKDELLPSIRFVLECFDKEPFYDVPFIWTYRRDYLHEHISSSHLWFIWEMRKQWKDLEILRKRIDKKLEMLLYVIKNDDEELVIKNDDKDEDKDEEKPSSSSSSVKMFKTHEEKLNHEIKTLESSCNEPNNDFKYAKEHLEKLQEQDDRDEGKIEEAMEELEKCQRKLKDFEMKLHNAQEDLKYFKELFDGTKTMRFKKSIVQETLRLFPLERYKQRIVNGDEQELKYISDFFNILSCDLQTNSKRIIVSKEYLKYKSITVLRQFMEKISVPACDVGDALRLGIKSEPPHHDDDDVTCEEDETVKFLIKSKTFKSSEEVIKSAIICISTELANEPTVRKIAKDLFKSRGSISTIPTTKGLTVITPFSEYFGIHYLIEKPISDFFIGNDRTLFVKLKEAKKLGLIDIHFNFIDCREEFVYKMRNILLPAKVPKPDLLPTSWNNTRIKAIESCFEMILLPNLEVELSRELMKLGREVIIEEASIHFEHFFLRIGSYRPPQNDFRMEMKDLLLSCPNKPFVGSVACIYLSQSREPMCLSYVNKEGVVRCHDMLPENVMNQKFMKIKEFLLQNKPDVIVLNSSGGHNSRSTSIEIEKTILPEVCEIINKKMRKRREGINSSFVNSEDDEDEDGNGKELMPYKANVVIIHDEIAKIFKNSLRAKHLFPDLHPGCAAAICLARFVQEPLAEVCNLWTLADANEIFGFESFFLNLHPLKNVLEGTKYLLFRNLEYKLVDAVCSVGVDINKVIKHEHLSSMLMFVGGLGLRKADALKQNIRNNLGVVDSRKILLEKKLLGKSVWTNAIGFLRINNVNVGIDPLDNTRIHPECYITYNFAPKICSDVLEKELQSNDYVEIVEELMDIVKKEWEKRIKKYPKWLDLWENGRRPSIKSTEFSESAIAADGTEHIMGLELNDSLSLLELDEYAKDLESQEGLGKRRLQLDQIKDELRFPWLDTRMVMKPMSSIDMFHILTNESDYSLYVGLKVSCEVKEIVDKSFHDSRSDTYKRSQFAKVETEIGLRGVIAIAEVSDEKIDFNSFDLSGILPVGKHVVAVVVNINKEKLQLDLSIKPSYLNNDEAWWMEKRNRNKFAKEWWLNIKKKDPTSIFDRFFDESEALKKYSETEKLQRKTAEVVNNQMNTISIFSSNSIQGSAKNNVGGNSQKVRIIHHPLFANLDYKAAEEKLRNQSKGPGEVVIRPSSKGPEYLTITWAYRENYFKHIIIQEKGKKVGDIGLGNQLVIVEDDMLSRNETFSDLDEIFSRYIVPMNDLISAMTQHRNFHPGTPQEVELAMKNQLIDRPNRIPYFIRFEPKMPGQFVLTWLSLNANSSTPVKADLIAVRPYGYTIRNETFARASEIIVWFKNIMETKLANEAVAAQTKATTVRKSRFTQDRASKYVIDPLDQANNMNRMNQPAMAYTNNTGY